MGIPAPGAGKPLPAATATVPPASPAAPVTSLPVRLRHLTAPETRTARIAAPSIASNPPSAAR